MAYYIKKQGLSGKVVYWTGGNVWSDDIAEKKTYVNKGTADAKILNCLLYTSPSPRDP